MEKLFNPDSIAIIGISSKPNNIPKLILENLLRWGYMGRIFGINPRSDEVHVNGIKMYREVGELPIVPDLVVALVPARFVPGVIEACGQFGVKRMAIPSGGFNELGEEGKKLADRAVELSKQYGIIFVGPNAVTIANTDNGLCLPFVPSYSPPRGGLSIISQSGGVGLMFWNFLTDENIGMAKFASIGNKLSLDEVDFLEYFGRDPLTKTICMYLESIPRGKDFIETASRINKPIIVLKANRTEAGRRAAMSHTGALQNNDDIINSAFERAGIIRVDDFTDFISVAKTFELPPLRGKRIMVMSPAGGCTVMMADMCEEMGFEFADPGEKFYTDLKSFANAGVINFSNPLDMGDIYDPVMYTHIFYSVMHNDNVDGAVYVSQWPHMPRGEDVFYRMFHTDLSKETIGTILSSGKPLAACLFGLSKTISRIKQSISMPVFNSIREMLIAMKKQYEYYSRPQKCISIKTPDSIDFKSAKKWVETHKGTSGEEAFELLSCFGINNLKSGVAADERGAVDIANRIGYPVVIKVISPDALHKSEAGGVELDIKSDDELKLAFIRIKENLYKYKKDAVFNGCRITQMAGAGYDMFAGGACDASFGPVVYFGYGGLYIEVFHDVQSVLCPSNGSEIEGKLKRLKSYSVLKGARGKRAGDINGYIDIIERVSHLMATFPQIKELDLNPVRVLADGTGVVALDVRVGIE
jgi:acetate---CoA ligase (ADP-forming)